jgi:predicted nucleotidyltransferase
MFLIRKQGVAIMDLSEVLSTKKREEILNEILFREEQISVAVISKSLKLSKGFVSRFFVILTQQKIMKKSKKKYNVADNLNVRLLKILFNLKQFSDFNFKRYTFVRGVGLYGSCAKGENSESSDVDIWVAIKIIEEENLAKLTGALKKKSRKISPLYLTKEKLEVLKKDDPIFLYSLIFGSIRIYGEDLV